VSNCTAITVVSEAIKEKIDEFGTNTPVSVIPMGVDTVKFNKNKVEDFLREKYQIKGAFLLFVGRLSEKKGVGYLIKAMPMVLNQCPDAKLLIVGHGELDAELKKLVNVELKISSSVIFAGGIPNNELPKYYATADVFIGPSIIAQGGDREGFPVSFMEAMACETPLIISDIQIFSYLRHEHNALKAKEKNSVSIANSLISMLFNFELRQHIIINNNVLVSDTFSLDVVGRKYLDILV